jgi:hypothetical protein
VGKGPAPTRVVYAFTTPIVQFTCFGAIPSPVKTPPMVVLEDVTYGNVPKSMSSSAALAPSMRTRSPAAIDSWMKDMESTI